MGFLSRFSKKADPAEARPDALALVERGHVLLRAGQPDTALAIYRRATEVDPSCLQAWTAAAGLLQRQGRRDEAIEHLRLAAASNPGDAVAQFHHANALVFAGRFHDAIEGYRRAIAIDPKLAAAHGNLANALGDTGQFEAAADAYRAAIALDPASPDVHFNLGKCMADLGRYDAAIESYERAIALRPAFADAHYNLGNAFVQCDRLRQAVASFESAVSHNPQFADAYTNLGNALSATGLHEAAEASLRKAIALAPNSHRAHSSLGTTLYSLGRLAEAVASYRRAIEISPTFDQAYTAMLFALSHDESVTAEQLFAEHLRFGAAFARPAPAPHDNLRDADRPLRVGIVSADLRNHALAYFVEPLLVRLAARRDMSLHAYYNYHMEDHVTRRLRASFAQWTHVHAMRDDAFADRIRDDRIDVLIDLTGHTGGNRLVAFARKPAPVQASWMGYPGTTGLSAMDYYIGDRHFLPLPAMRSQFTEKIVHLPASAPFLPSGDAPEVNALPALSGGRVTFGSFNRLSKLRPAAVALWASALRAVPDARMIVAGMPEDGRYGELLEWFGREGIDRNRLSFRSRCDIAAYFAMHHEVDMLLDTYPYTGGTTTLHALWMGVPTLTLAGATAASRQGATILAQAGLDGFVASDREDYARKAAHWASNLDALASIRAELRDRCRRSPVQHPDVIAEGLAQAIRAMWRQWCAALPPQEIDASGASAV